MAAVEKWNDDAFTKWFALLTMAAVPATLISSQMWTWRMLKWPRGLQRLGSSSRGQRSPTASAWGGKVVTTTLQIHPHPSDFSTSENLPLSFSQVSGCKKKYWWHCDGWITAAHHCGGPFSNVSSLKLVVLALPPLLWQADGTSEKRLISISWLLESGVRGPFTCRHLAVC